MGVTITVEGMSCGHGEQTVQEALKGVPGVQSATADREAARATVEGDADPGSLIDAVEETGDGAHA